jgi:hypothetical protein
VLMRNNWTMTLQHPVDRRHDRRLGWAGLPKFRVNDPGTPPRVVNPELHYQ